MEDIMVQIHGNIIMYVIITICYLLNEICYKNIRGEMINLIR